MAEDLRNKPTSPKAAQTSDSSDEVASLKAQVDRLEAMLMATIRSQPPVDAITPDTLWARQHLKEQKIKADLDEHAARFQHTCQERTQWAANKLNPEATKLFKISVGWCPEIIMRANDVVMAKAYYNQLCGIISVAVNHNNPKMTDYNIVEVTNDPKAQEIVKTNWEYKAAA
jgi:hypothetical protein